MRLERRNVSYRQKGRQTLPNRLPQPLNQLTNTIRAYLPKYVVTIFLKALDQNGMYQRHNLVALASIGKIHKVVILHCTEVRFASFFSG